MQKNILSLFITPLLIITLIIIFTLYKHYANYCNKKRKSKLIHGFKTIFIICFISTFIFNLVACKNNDNIHKATSENSYISLYNASDSLETEGVIDFDLKNYQWEIDNFHIEENLGEISSPATATKKAKSLWTKTFNGVDKPLFDLGKTKEFQVAFDTSNGCWHIYGEAIPDTLGGTPHAIIKTDGEVLAVWIED